MPVAATPASTEMHSNENDSNGSRPFPMPGSPGSCVEGAYVLTDFDGVAIESGGNDLRKSSSSSSRPPSLNDLVDQFRYRCGLIVENEDFQRIVIVIIVLNSITMGVATFDFVTNDPSIDAAFERVDRAFLILFTIELALQFIHKGMGVFACGWLTFDFVVVVVSWAFASFRIIRAFRIVRVLRLVARVEALRDVVRALVSVVPRMFAVGILLLLIFYVFAVMFTQLFKNMYSEGATSQDYFSRIDVTCFTLFQIMTLDSWSTVTKEVMATYGWAWLPFITFVMISSFIVINLIIAVICDAVSALHVADIGSQIRTEREQEEEQRQQKKEEELRSKAFRRHTSQDSSIGDEHDNADCGCCRAGELRRLEAKVEELADLVRAAMERQHGDHPGDETLRSTPAIT